MMTELENNLLQLRSVLRETAFAAYETIEAIEGLQRKLREQPTVDAKQSWFQDGQLRMLKELHAHLLKEQERSALLLRDAPSVLDAPLHKSEPHQRTRRWVADAAELAEMARHSVCEAGQVVRICMQMEAESPEDLTRLDIAIREYGCVAESMAGLCDLLVRQLKELEKLNVYAAPSRIFEHDEVFLCQKRAERSNIDDRLFDLFESTQSAPPVQEAPQLSSSPMPEANAPSIDPQASSTPKFALPGAKPVSTAQTAPPVPLSVPVAHEYIADKQPVTILPGAAQDTPPQEKRSLLGFLKKRKKEAQAVAPPRVDKVQFSAVAPEKLVPDNYLPINIVMYEDTMRKVVEEILHRLGDRAKESKSGYHEVAHNAVIRVVLTSADLAVDDGEEEQVWTGNYLNFSFTVKIPENFDQAQALFTATVYINGIIATKLKLILDCDAPPKRNIRVSRNDFLSAFVSYASQDRHRVAAIIQGMKKARPDMDIFFDVESLRSGQNWEESLQTEIARRDILFLCWSRFARESKWVDMEWRYALLNKGEDCIDPIPIDSPDVCPPPVELQRKHFNDRMLYIIKATEPNNCGYPYLLRSKTNEKVLMNKPSFIIGKERAYVDYWIGDNPSISRSHAKLICQDGLYYIVDTNSTNHTYVNDEKIPSNQEIPIGWGAIIRLADEEFKFIC